MHDECGRKAGLISSLAVYMHQMVLYLHYARVIHHLKHVYYNFGCEYAHQGRVEPARLNLPFVAGIVARKMLLRSTARNQEISVSVVKNKTEFASVHMHCVNGKFVLTQM
jgi:hypothetical protein